MSNQKIKDTLEQGKQKMTGFWADSNNRRVLIGGGVFALLAIFIFLPSDRPCATGKVDAESTTKAGAGNGGDRIAKTTVPHKTDPVVRRTFVRATSSPMVIKEGKKLFVENCAACHREDAIGKPGEAPSLTNPELLSISSSKFLMGTIRDGREDTGMPPFGHLGRSKVSKIVSYLQSFATLPDRSKQVDLQPDAHGDPRLGQQWYNSVCSTCHGLAGDGYESGGTGTAIGLPGFLNKVSDGFLRVTIKEGRSNTRMLGFSGPKAMANLSDREIDDIIVYLRSLARNK